jgi:hypothetical protein
VDLRPLGQLTVETIDKAVSCQQHTAV